MEENTNNDWMCIDFGTSSSAAAIIRDNKPEIVEPSIASAVGAQIYPTISWVDEDQKIHSCHEADYIKSKDISRFRSEYKIIMDEKKIPDLNVFWHDLVKGVLSQLKKDAENKTGNEINNVVLTVPCLYFEKDVRMDVMKKAAKDAGFSNIEILKESESAAIYYDFVEERHQEESISLIYDLGGGTFDPSIIKHNKENYELLGNGRGIEVGGKFFTEFVTQKIDEILKKTGFIFSETPITRLSQYQNIVNQADKIKKILSDRDNADVNIEISEKSYPFKISRKEFEEEIKPKIKETLASCSELIAECNIQHSEIDKIILVGGSCAIPCIQNEIKSFLNANNASSAKIIYRNTEGQKPFHPQFAVALGGAVYAMKKYSPEEISSPEINKPENKDQTQKAGENIVPIVFKTKNAMGATAEGLPKGINGTWNENIFTITGKLPESETSDPKTYNYSVKLVPLEGYNGEEIKIEGKIRVEQFRVIRDYNF